MREPDQIVPEAHPQARRRRKLVTGLVAATMLIAAFLFWTRKVSEVPVFTVAFVRSPYDDSLVARYDRKGNLLVTRASVNGDPAQLVYRYRPDTAQLDRVPTTEWHTATGLAVSSEAYGDLSGGAQILGGDGTLRFVSPGRVPHRIVTKGKTALDGEVSPTGDLVAIVTTDGKKRFGTRGWWVSFGGGYGGQHYIEIFDAAKDMAPRRAVRIPFTTGGGIEAMAWSEDAKYLVVLGSDGRMVVIPTSPTPLLANQ